MNVLLKYGQFTSMIQMSKVLPEISIMKPNEALSIVPLEEYEPFDVSSRKNTILVFRFKEQVSEELCIYEFWGER